MDHRRSSKTRVRVTAVRGETIIRRQDWLATEEPLEIRVTDVDTLEPVLTHVTMRTPGNDFELAAGFLLAEGIIRRSEQIRQMEFCVGPKGLAVQQYNIVSVEVTGVESEHRAGTHFRTAVSACGVCGKASLDELTMRGIDRIDSGITVAQSLIEQLPDLLRERQPLFEATGGLHGAALVTAEGRVLAVREDVGRHNAVDKLLGWSLLNPVEAKEAVLLMVSGRLSYELAQKAVVGRLALLVGVSAPSSLAVELADEFGLTLIGFARGESFTVYTHPRRIGMRARE